MIIGWLKKHLRDSESGVAMVMVLVLVALSVPLVTTALGLSSTLAIDSGVKTRLLEGQYSALGSTEYVLYRILYEAGFPENLTPGIPDIQTITLNGESMDIVTVIDVGSAEAPPPPDVPGLTTTKGVTPTTASVNTLTTFTYTITIENTGAGSIGVTEVHDGLPPDFSYVASSTTGVTTDEPSIQTRSNGGAGQDLTELTWDISSLNIVLAPTETVVLTFQSEASVGEGNYCNLAWPEPGGKPLSSGPTAKIVVGTPADSNCEGELVSVTKSVTPETAASNADTTFTYTIAIENLGSETAAMVWIKDLLPAGFSYVDGSAGGGITVLDPSEVTQNGRMRLRWNVNSSLLVGQTQYLTFQATANLGRGTHYNEVWGHFSSLSKDTYSWPTAPVYVADSVSVSVSVGGVTGTLQVWVDENGEQIVQRGVQ